MVKHRLICRVLTAVILLLLLFGAAQAGSGAWILAKATLAQYLLADAWEKTLVDKAFHKPWPWADTWPVARLTAPHLATDVIILSGDHGEALAFGPGHHSRSAMPGTVGTILIGGHRDTHFKFLQALRSGDLVRLQSQTGEWLEYRVTGMSVANARTDHILTSDFDSILVLVTCWPFDALTTGGPLRYVVYTERVELETVSF